MTGRFIIAALALWLLGCGDDAAAVPAVAAPEVVDPLPPAPVASVAGTDLWIDLVAQRPSATISRPRRIASISSSAR